MKEKIKTKVGNEVSTLTVSYFNVCGCCGEFYVNSTDKLRLSKKQLSKYVSDNGRQLFVITDEDMNTIDLCDLFKYKLDTARIEQINWEF